MIVLSLSFPTATHTMKEVMNAWQSCWVLGSVQHRNPEAVTTRGRLEDRPGRPGAANCLLCAVDRSLAALA